MTRALVRFSTLLAAVTTLAACSTVPMGSPQASFEVIQKINASGMKPLGMDAFGPGAGLNANDDHSLGVRAATLTPPEGETFSGYLGELLKKQLLSGGKLDPTSPTHISGVLDTNTLHAASISKNDAQLAATFTVKRGDKVLYHHQIEVDSTWDSSFLGAVAIPTAINQYSSLYKMLLVRLFDDKDFIDATRDGATVSLLEH